MPKDNEIPKAITEQENDRKDAVFPPKKNLTQTEWQDFISNNVGGFTGNVEAAARLMVAYQRGRDYLYSKFSAKFSELDSPDIMIVIDESKVQSSPFGSVEGVNKIFVTKSLLEQFSSYQQNSTCEVLRQDGGVAIKDVTPDQVFELHGVEETHHSVFTGIKVSKGLPMSPGDADLTSYDSQEHEYRALRWQVRYATENKFPNSSIKILKDRLDNAQSVRLKK